jgi:dienelactone hydrolase
MARCLQVSSLEEPGQSSPWWHGYQVGATHHPHTTMLALLHGIYAANFLLLFLFFLPRGIRGCGDRCALPVSEVSLGVDECDSFRSEVLLDVYQCNVKHSRRGSDDDDLRPLIIFAPGAPLPKDKYTLFATGLANKGYVVMVLEHPAIMSGQHETLYFTSPADLANAISYAEAQTDFAVDTDNIIVVGHSFGASSVLFALDKLCHYPFCIRGPVHFAPVPAPVPLHPGVKAAVAFGFSLFDPRGVFVHVDNAGTSLLILNGGGDMSATDKTLV